MLETRGISIIKVSAHRVFTPRHSVREVRILTGRITEVGSKSGVAAAAAEKKWAKHITRNHNV